MGIEVTAGEDPRVSIVIPAFRNAGRLRDCLASLARNTGPGVVFETVVIANGASPDVLSVLDAARGIRVVRSDVNLGFAGGCNLGAAHASGELLVLLNDDVEVEPGWLEALVATADAHPDAGAVGSRMLFTDGTLHEAGSIVWADGSTTAVGRGLEAGTRRWRHLRQVDYCSAAALLVRASAWRAVGGMDQSFHPGYCEDVDLCFAMQEAGMRILYDPRSTVFHHESSSTDELYKYFLMRRNRERLRAKWRERLGRQEPDPERPGAIERALWRARGFPRRVLAVSGRLPPPGVMQGFFDDVDATRTAVVACPAEQADDAACAPLEALGVEVAGEPPERHVARPDRIYDVVIVDERRPAVDDALRRHQPQAVVLDAAPPPAAGRASSWRDAVAAALLGRSPDRLAQGA